MRAARVIFQVHSLRAEGLTQAELEGVLARHPVETGSLGVTAHHADDAGRVASGSLPPARDFSPPLDFETYARLRQARWIYRIEATEVEPEDLGYLRAALLCAGEVAAMTDGLIVDLLAFTTLAAEEVAREIDRPFDPLRHVCVHVERGPRPYFVHTHGLEKFGHPDLELHGVPRGSVDVARSILRHVVAAVVAGGRFRAGETTQLCGFHFAFAASGHPEPAHFSNGSLCLGGFELLGDVVTPEMEGMLVA